MGAFFSLWDTRGRNIINTFDSGSPALRVAAELIDAFGTDYANDLELSWTSNEGEHRVIATGKALIDLSAVPPRRRPATRTLPEFRRKIESARERVAS